MKWFILILLVISKISAKEADYVIVGTGTAGALLAKRLSDDKTTSVIALHAGQNFSDSFLLKYAQNTPFSFLAPLLGAFNFEGLPSDMQEKLQDFIKLCQSASQPLYEWGLSVPQPFAQHRQVPWVIPLPEGGASSVNASLWCRATTDVMQKWEALNGPNWGPKRLKSLYQQLEDYHGKTIDFSRRGKNGPIKVLQDSPASPSAEVFSKALQRASGLPYVLDYNDPATPIGISERMQVTHEGRDHFLRLSSSTAFLNEKVIKKNGKGVKGRKLRVLYNSFGLRTLWEGNTAIGVEYVQDGVIKQVYAKKGVIVSCGLRSSAFLLHSGIGDKAALEALNIPVIFDNPNVGQGLVDQPHVALLFLSNPKDSVAGTGRFFAQIAWLPSLDNPPGNPIDRQIRISTIDVFPGFTLALVDLCQPKSRGKVSINSQDPKTPPVIDLGLLSDPSDLDLFVYALETYVKGMAEELKAIDPHYRLLFPHPAVLDDPVLLADFIRSEVASTMNFQSHCRMAPLDQGGVVDASGRVYGVNRLFIADNSINPTCMDGTPMSTAYLIAENIVQLLGSPM